MVSSSSFREQSIPSERIPRSIPLRIVVPTGRTAPSSATGTRSPSWMFHAPVTICRVLSPPIRTTPAGFIFQQGSEQSETVRPQFNEYLEKYGGNIGYSVVPGERRKGYATGMLKAALPLCRELGLKRVLISCIQGNEGSKRAILHNGGVYESTVWEPDEQLWLERYWISLEE